MHPGPGPPGTHDPATPKMTHVGHRVVVTCVQRLINFTATLFVTTAGFSFACFPLSFYRRCALTTPRAPRRLRLSWCGPAEGMGQDTAGVPRVTNKNNDGIVHWFLRTLYILPGRVLT